MSTRLFERKMTAPPLLRRGKVIDDFADAVAAQLKGGEVPVRLAVTESLPEGCYCEAGLLTGLEGGRPIAPLFRFIKRPVESADSFNAVLLVPTGIGAEIGGHAGDASPVAKLLASACDVLITHPNVVNASDIIDLPDNAQYVEGSIITRLLMGSVGLQGAGNHRLNNRLLAIIGHHDDELFTHAAINSVNAARASYGLSVARIIQLGAEFEMSSSYTASGRAAGRIEGLDHLLERLERHWGEYDAVAITSQIIVPPGYHADYFDSQGEMVNPWGGVEAMLTHAVSTLYDVPSAHAPMLETQEIANADPGIVDPRMAAEAVSLALIQCILKGLQRSPRIVADPVGMRHSSVLTAADISCLVIPDGCIGLPTLAALEQGITVIGVRENHNLMRNDLAALPWAPGQFYPVENYWEAAGVMTALQAGIDPATVRRPLSQVPVEGAQGKGNNEE